MPKGNGQFFLTLFLLPAVLTPAGAAETVAGSVAGVRLDAALCRNLASGQTVSAALDGGSWDCTAAGFTSEPLDPLALAQLTTRLPQRRATLREANPQPFDVFGSAVAIDGDVAVVGTPGDDTAGNFAGSATVFRFDGSKWVREQALTGSDTDGFDAFGQSVAIQGHVAVIGAPLAGGGGRAYAFRFDGVTWIEEQLLAAGDISPLAQFGDRVAIDADTILVGAPSAALSGDFVGAVYVFRHDGAAWVEQQKLRAGDPEQNQDFGQGVAIEGPRALIGAPGDNDRAGAVYVFGFDGVEWIAQRKLTASDGLSFDYFGTHLDLDGDRAAIGAWNADAPEPGSGAAYLFEFDGVSWTEQQKLTGLSPSNGANFGDAIALRGNLLIVGAPGQAPEGGLYVYRPVGSAWELRQIVYPENEGLNDGFGNAAALSGSVAVVGSTQVNGESGLGYVYDLASMGGRIDTGQPGRVTCRNLDTQESVDAVANGGEWDCEAAGLTAAPGERVLFTEFSRAE